jgi:site-specific DNA recombinase
MARSTEKQKSAVFGYARVSTGKQEHSIPAQVDKIRAQALLKDLELTGIIEDEDASAKSLERPGMKRLLEMVERGELSTVIITKLDRLTRRIADIDKLLQLFDRKKVTLISTAESLDTASATGRMMVNLIVLMSQWEREIIGERTQEAMAGMKRRGLQIGNVPYGFKRGNAVGTNKQGKVVFNLTWEETEQDVLRMILALRSCSKPLSFQAIADELNKSGFKTRRGSNWKAEYVWNVMRNFKKGTSASASL